MITEIRARLVANLLDGGFAALLVGLFVEQHAHPAHMQLGPTLRALFEPAQGQ
jgi:hypothetical protein